MGESEITKSDVFLLNTMKLRQLEEACKELTQEGVHYEVDLDVCLGLKRAGAKGDTLSSKALALAIKNAALQVRRSIENHPKQAQLMSDIYFKRKRNKYMKKSIFEALKPFALKEFES
ncbi:hypothetical protein [Litchfieldella xinjiangensis]|uniref:hypothetical protein n=1 Tax=Litchfieldella xinjiangensis TaxID=1166948 RepID=UPI0005BACE33|nr:hypothetical protein [Halomonas xinjiangensis]